MYCDKYWGGREQGIIREKSSKDVTERRLQMASLRQRLEE